MGLRAALGLLTALLATLPAAGQDASGPTPVGMAGVRMSVVLPGPELVAKPLDRTSRLVLRVLASYPHGDGHRYDLEFVGREPGTYDLCAHLVRPDGSAVEGLPRVEVEVVPTLEPGRLEPNQLQVGGVPRIGGYTQLAIGAGILWGAGLVTILVLSRRRRLQLADAAAGARGPTLAERLQPLIDDALAERLDSSGQARLEMLLLNYWRDRIDVEGLAAPEAMQRLRAHPEAGELIRGLEAWLHQPPARRQAGDLDALLAPYRDLPSGA